MSWKELKNIIKEKTEERKIYFSEKEEEILTFNLLIFKRLTVICFLVVVLYILIIGVVLAKWIVTPFHIALLIWLGIHIFIAFYINKHPLKSKPLEKAVCIVFSLCLFILLICIDTIASPTSSQTFCSAFLVIAPTIFIMKTSRMIIDQFFFVIVYAFFAFRFKELPVATHDMFAIWAGFFLGIIAFLIIMDLRIRVNAEVIRLKHFSEIDELTKIKNRRAANAQITYMLEQRDADSKCALMVLDVDLFKKINDTYGHKTGDIILIEVAKVLTSTFRETDVISRFGGDEFIVFVCGFKEDGFLTEKCQEIQRKVHDILDNEFHVSCSIGMCIQVSGGVTMDDMVCAADEALYETKERERGTYTVVNL